MSQHPRTLAQKIIARAAGQDVRPGDMVTCRVDLLMGHDNSGPRRWKPHMDRLGVGLWDPSKIVIVTDHNVPPADHQTAGLVKIARDFVRDHGIEKFHDMEGISHIVLAENGYLKPGMFVAGGDSHSPNGGAFGAYMAGYGFTDTAAIAITGETWVVVPETVRVTLDGALSSGVAAKDVMLMLCRELGMDNNFKVIEYDGALVDGLHVEQRMVLCNMAAELGAETAIMAPDDTTLTYIISHGGRVDPDARDWRSDPDAPYENAHRFDTAALPPQVAAPHSPANSGPVGEVEPVHVDQCYIGACTGAKLSDLHMAAEVMKGRTVAKGTRLMIAPASTRATRAAAADGTLATLTAAGAILLPTGCGACAGMGAGILAEGEVCMASTARNFKGRMGHAASLVYLGSPYTVAATAIEGRIADPRPYLAPAREMA